MIDTIQTLLGQWVLFIVGFCTIAYGLACLLLFLAQNRFIFFPSRVLQITPDQFNLVYEDVWLSVKTPSGEVEQIHGWWIPSPSATDERVILDLHGNGSNISSNLGYALQFHQMGLSVLLIDYRGYGCSTNRFPTEKTVYQDVEVAWQYLIYDRGIDPQKIFIFGHSLGGAIAINLALRHPEIAGLIIESSFTSIRDMVDYQRKYWMFPIDFILTHRFDSIRKVKELKMPVLFTHGTEDATVPVSMSHALYAATPAPKQLLIVPGADHNNVRQVGGVEYWNAIHHFLAKSH